MLPALMEEFDESRQKTGESHFESGVTLWLYVRQPGRVFKKLSARQSENFRNFFLLVSLINRRESALVLKLYFATSNRLELDSRQILIFWWCC